MKTSYRAINFHYRKLGTDGSSSLLTCSRKERRAQSPYWAFDVRVRSLTVLHQILLQPLSCSQRVNEGSILWLEQVKTFWLKFFSCVLHVYAEGLIFFPVWTCSSFYLFILMSYISVVHCCLKYFVLFMWGCTLFVIWNFIILRMWLLFFQEIFLFHLNSSLQEQLISTEDPN